MSIKSSKNSKPVKAAKAPISVASANGLTTLSATELHYLISQRAYEIYLQRGADSGSQLDDWLLAEQEITAVIQTAVPAPSATKTRSPNARPSTVKASAKRSATARTRKKPAPEI